MSDEYEIESILKHKMVANTIYYMVKWKGYELSDATWEPESHLETCEDLLRKYKKNNGLLESKKNQKIKNSKIAEIIDIDDGSSFETGIYYKIRCVGESKYIKVCSEEVQDNNIQLLIDFLESKLPI